MKDQAQTNEKRKTLADLASESLILILQLRATSDYGNASSLKDRVAEMFDRFERDSRSLGIDNEKETRLIGSLFAKSLPIVVILTAVSQEARGLSPDRQV